MKSMKSHAEQITRRYNTYCERLLEAPYHLRNVACMRGDYMNILDQYGKDPRTVIYLDPTYHPATRVTGAINVYQNELDREQHQQMVDRLLSCRSFVVSGYDPSEYDCDDYKPLDRYCDEKICIGKYRLTSGSRNKNQIKVKSEWLWIKY